MASAPLKIIKNPLRRKMTSAGEEGCVGESRNRIGQNGRAAELMCDERHMGARVHVRCYVFPSSAFSLLPFNVVWCVEYSLSFGNQCVILCPNFFVASW